MSFLFPLGLLGLIGIPIVIIIYILQSKYNEQTVTSTYIWHLSDKFMKKKNPFSGLTGLISLILQILTIAAISFAIARPIFILPNAAYDYCFVLDASGSMNIKNGNKTRFDLAKAEIMDLIKSSADGSAYTLVSVSSESTLVFENVSSKDAAIEAVKNLSPAYESHEFSKIYEAAQNRFEENNSEIIYVLTDKAYGEYENVEVIDLSGDDVENYGLFDVNGGLTGGILTATGYVSSYMKNTDLEIKLYVDGAKTESSTQIVSAKKGKATEFEISAPCESYSSFEVVITNADAYAQDNSVICYNLKSESKVYSTLIVGELKENQTGFYYEAIFDAISDFEVTSISSTEYKENTEKYAGYGLYVFDSYSPSELPEGAVWLINTQTSIPGSGFNAKAVEKVSPPKPLEKSNSTKVSTKTLLKNVDGKNIYIGEYVKYSGFYLRYETLFSYDNYPVIFTTTNETGNRQVVVGFDLYNSTLQMTPDFVVLFSNLLKYSFPDVVERASYTVGEEVLVNVLQNSENLKAYDPDGKELYMDASGATATLKLSKIGTYTISLRMNGMETAYKIYSNVHKDESNPNEEAESFALDGVRGNEKRDGTFDPLMILFICAFVLFIADWGVYCYEKYQLR